MLNYEELLIKADNAGLIVKEKNLVYNDGRLRGKCIAIRKNIPTLVKKACVLAEEIGHYHTTEIDILDQSSVANKKLERAGRVWAYDKQIGLLGIIQGYRARCQNLHELAEYLEVTEDFLLEALKCYKEKHGIMAKIDGYTIIFEPSLAVVESIK